MADNPYTSALGWLSDNFGALWSGWTDPNNGSMNNPGYNPGMDFVGDGKNPDLVNAALDQNPALSSVPRLTSGQGYEDIASEFADAQSGKPTGPSSPGSPSTPVGLWSSAPRQRNWSYLNADLAGAYHMSKSTAYQEALANTAHQREVRDLQAAGLNPVLSANGGNGASVFAPTEPTGRAGGGGSGSKSSGKGLLGTVLGLGLALAGAPGSVVSATSKLFDKLDGK